MPIFAISVSGVINNIAQAKLYFLKVYNESDSLVRDFVPVSSPKGNCMFDRVSQKLFCNEGTGEFLTD